MMRLQDFEIACRRLVATTPRCAGWTLTFVERDFQREFVVTAVDGSGVAALVVVPSATATPSTSAETLAALGKLLHELRTGDADAMYKYCEILGELTQARSVGFA